MARKKKLPGVTNEVILTAQAGDQEALNHVVKENMGLVYMMLHKLDAEPDLFLSVGMEAILNAIRLFDTRRKIKFSTYASIAIYRNIKRAKQLREKQRHLDVPLNYDIPGSEPDERFSEDEIQKNYEWVKSVAMEVLPERYWEILILRQTHTLDSVGKVFNIGKERVRQIQEDALEKLREALKVPA